MHNKLMGQTRTCFTEVYVQSLSADCDLDLWPSDMVFVCDTLSCHDDQFAVLFLNPTMHNKVMSRTRTGYTEVSAQSLSADCDLDLLVRDTSSCHDHLYQIIFKSLYVWLSYGQDMILEYTNTHTHTLTGELYMPFRHFMVGGIKNGEWKCLQWPGITQSIVMLLLILGSLGDPLTKLHKPYCFVEQDGRQS